MHHVLAEHSQYVGEGVISGKLYEISGYPGVVESSHPVDIVTGELYRLDKAERLLPLLDAYEECSPAFPVPHEYLRKRVKVHLDAGGSVTAWVYLYNRSISGRTQITSGDYTGFYRDNSVASD